MKRNLLTLVSSLTLLLCATSSLFAQDKNPPEKMTFQGFLTDDTGVPYGNTAPVNQTITFKIFAAPTGDAPHLWGESQVVTIDKGHFSVLLGLGSEVGNRPPLYDVFTGVDASSRWMELTVGDKVISPRIQFFAAPYAQLARVANELAPGASASEFKVDGLFTVSGNIEAESITGTSLNLGSGNIDAGSIRGANLIVNGIVDSALAYTDTIFLDTGFRVGPLTSNWIFEAKDVLNTTYATLRYNGNATSPLFRIDTEMAAISYRNLSDGRFKKVHGRSKGAEDLSVLRNIKIQNYEWIENKKFEKKVIAQQVKEVYPQAVSILPGYSPMPNISSKAANVHYDNARSELHVVMDKPHALAVGDSIDMLAGKTRLKEKKVIQITDKNTFVVSGAESYDDIFVIGKYVNDILTVDYDAIAMLNVSATQELARQAEELESRVRDLEARERRVALLEENLEAKMSRMEVFEKRLDALDKRLVSVSPQIDRNTEGLQVSVSTGSSR